MRKSIRLNVLAAALAVTCAPAFSHAEDLMQIYQAARQADPTLAGADANKGAVGEGVDQARSFLLPQIGATWGYNHSDGSSSGVSPQQDGSGNFVLLSDLVTSRDRSRPAQATLTQSIFNWGNIERLRGSRAQAASAVSNYDAAAQALIVRTATAYFGVLTAQDQLTLCRRRAEKAFARQLDQAEQRFQVGLSAITDVHEARANHDSSVAQVIQAQNNVDNARETISQITGKDFGDLKKLREKLPMEKPDAQRLAGLGRYRGRAESGNPVRQAVGGCRRIQHRRAALRTSSHAECLGRAQRHA